MRNKAIGIIGGMVPTASQYFYGQLIRYAQKYYGAKKNEDFPEIYLASVPVPDFVVSREKKGKALKILLERLSYFNKLPISFYCIACNTAHLILNELRLETNKPFISLLEEVPLFLKKKKIRRIGLLASPVTIKTKMYYEPLKKIGIELAVPSINDIKILGQIILETIAGDNYRRNRELVQKIADRLIKKGAEGILIGCTEISFLFPEGQKIKVFDTLDILAKAVLEKYYLL